MSEDDNLFKTHLQAKGKLEYVQGKKRPEVDCILCAIVKDSPKVQKYKVYQDKLAVISLNLYPYNVGHLLVFPIRHVTEFTELTDEELIHLSHLIQNSQKMLSKVYNPTGFNIGINQGNFAGASIPHLHYHVIPRFRGELGYIDIVGKTRIVVEGISETHKKLKEAVPKFFK